MTGVCEETLGPGIAAYQQLSDAGKLCELAEFDDNTAAICRGATGATRNRAMWEADKKVLCALLCCCNSNPGTSESGANSYQGCVSATLGNTQRALGGDSRFKPEVSYNMRAFPPEPMMERGILGGLTTTPMPWNSGGISHMRNRIERDFPNMSPEYGRDTRRPDVVIVNDPSRPPTQDNISRVVEMKFGSDTPGRGQIEAYNDIGGRRTEVLDVEECGCSDDDENSEENTQNMTAFVTTAQSVYDSQVSMGGRVLAGVGTVLGGIATVGAALVPFDGPLGEAALGTLTAGLATRVFASSALSAAARQALARNAATAWTRIYRSGAL